MNPSDEAIFWQRKYFELLLHTTQVITTMGRPFIASTQQQGTQPKAGGTQ